MQCPQCKLMVEQIMQFCPNCGLKFAVAKKPTANLPIVFIILGVLAALCMVCGIFGNFDSLKTTTSSDKTQKSNTPEPIKTPALTEAETLAKIKTILDQKVLSKTEIDEAGMLIESLPENSNERRTWQSRFNQRKAAIEKQEQQIEAGAKKTARKIFAQQYEAAMLKNGFDFYIRTSGKDNEIITIKYVLMSRPFVYKVQNEMTILQDLRDAGFKKAVFTDGYDDTWTFDLTK